MSRVFMYVEYQIAMDFDQMDLDPIHTEMKTFPGMKSKTWLSGVNNKTVGGFYEFDTKENAQNYVDTGLVPYVAIFGANLTVKLFDAEIVAEASKVMGSPYF